MKDSSNNNNSQINEKDVVPEHDNVNYSAVPKGYTDWREDESKRYDSLPEKFKKQSYETLPKRGQVPGEYSSETDKTAKKERIFIPLLILLIIILLVLASWLFFGDTIMNLIR
jgi:hypothetical protein